MTYLYICSTLPCLDYAQLHVSLIPTEFISEYNLQYLVNNRWLYFQVFDKNIIEKMVTLLLFYFTIT